jgi:hypothetical protein
MVRSSATSLKVRRSIVAIGDYRTTRIDETFATVALLYNDIFDPPWTGAGYGRHLVVEPAERGEQ